MEYNGLTEEQLEAYCKANHVEYRVIREDDADFAGWNDNDLTRVNVEIDKGIVTDFYYG